MGWLDRTIVLALLVASGCCVAEKPLFGANTRLPAHDSVPAQVLLEPPPSLQLVREERISATLPRVSQPTDRDLQLAVRWSAPARPVDPASASAGSDDEDDAEQDDAAPQEPAEDDVEYADGEVRRVLVRRSRFATPEILVRAAIRNAEARRPRQLHGDRLLLRLAGPVCHCDGDAAERARVRAVMVAMIREARPALKRCLSAAIAHDPRVIAKEPTTLVVTQAMLVDDLVYQFSAALRVGPDGVEVHDVRWPDEGPAGDLTTCIHRALADASGVDTTALVASHDVRVPLVAFSQGAHGANGRGMHWLLSLQAAQLGWLHYARGDLEQALAYFEDAHWAFQLPEYAYLIGLANERLGRRARAAEAYRTFVEGVPYAPEVAAIEQRIDDLRAASK